MTTSTPRLQGLHPNIRAMMNTIAYTEGTDNGRQVTKDNGYDVLVGGALFSDYTKHPNRLVKLNAKLSSTAAGRYQILYRFWKHYQPLLKLPDFGPESQDKYVLQIFKEQRATALIEAGEFEQAIRRINNIWASLPESPYGQHTYSMAATKKVYLDNGGTLAK